MAPTHPTAWSLALSTSVVLIAFAGNSVLCRLALGPQHLDPLSFTAVRLASGALILLPWLGGRPSSRELPAAAALVFYALGFSLAYVSLPAGTGALLLFGTVQVTMVTAGLCRGERPSPVRWLGLLLALCGLVWLVLPGVSAPDPIGTLWMVAAGVGWGIYSLLGRGVEQPARVTARAFCWAAPVALLVVAGVAGSGAAQLHANRQGWMFSILSGAVTSGLGYVLWYRVLPAHSATRAAVVQLAVPVLAAFGGTWVLQEAWSFRLIGAGTLTLGGIGVALLGSQGRPT